MEIKWIPGYEGRYLASSKGKIISLYGGRSHTSKTLNPHLLKIYKTLASYYVNLRADGKKKTYTVGFLIAKTFLPNPEGHVNLIHRNHKTYNNSVQNLKWVSRQDMINHTEKRKKTKLRPLTSAELDEKFYALHGKPAWM